MVKSVCLCVPTFNASRTLSLTIDSILKQTYPSISILIIDNASTDNTVAIGQRYADRYKNVKVLTFKENIGAEGNFTRCIEFTAGDYTGIYHADDIYDSTIVEKQVAFLETQPEAGAVFTMARHIDSFGNIIGTASLPPEFKLSTSWLRTYTFQDIFQKLLRDHNFLICPSALVRTAIYKNHVRIWDGASFGTSADLAVWLKILERYQIGILPEPLISYRLSSSQGTVVLQHMNSDRADFFKVIDYYLKMPPNELKLTARDFRNLKFLKLRDNCRRAVNCIINGNTAEARKLTRLAIDPRLFLTALLTRPQRIVNRLRIALWIYSVLLNALSYLPKLSFFQKFLYYLKYCHASKLEG